MKNVARVNVLIETTSAVIWSNHAPGVSLKGQECSEENVDEPGQTRS